MWVMSGWVAGPPIPLGWDVSPSMTDDEPSHEVEAAHYPACNAGCFCGWHRMLSDQEAAWFEVRDQRESQP